MLSRTAENLYWMARYVERAECTARLIEMGRRMAMVPSAIDRDEWRSVVLASGATTSADDVERMSETQAIRLLLLDSENPSSIRRCLMQARNNGRAIRTALTQEMWEVLNESWRHLQTLDDETAKRDLPQTLEWVKTRSAMLRGAIDTGMLRTDGHDFLKLGSYIERADMMLRLLDVKYYVLLPETEVVGGGRDHYQWTSVLHATSAIRAYHHVYKGDYSPWQIADFLILNRNFPRSLAFSYNSVGYHLSNLARRYGERHHCHFTSNEMTSHIADLEVGEIFHHGLHEFISGQIAKNARLAGEIARAYHF